MDQGSTHTKGTIPLTYLLIKYMSSISEVDICEGVPPLKIVVTFYFRYILWYTKIATGFAPFFKDVLFCSNFKDARKYSSNTP